MVRLEPAVVFVDVLGLAVHHVDVGVGGEEPLDGSERSGGVEIVAVEPADDLSFRTLDSLVDGIGLPFVGLGEKAQPARIALQDIDGLVGAAAIDDQIVETLDLLLQDASQRALDESALVE